MMVDKIKTEAPAQVTTTVQPAAVHTEVRESLWSAGDIYFILAVVVALVIIAGFVISQSKRRTDEIKEMIKASHDDAARDTRELSDKVRDGRTVIEKDIEAIRADIRHEKAARATAVQATHHQFEKAAADAASLRDRTTTLEEKTRNQDNAIIELKQILREKIDETKDAIKMAGDATDKKLTMIETTIREISKRDLK